MNMIVFTSSAILYRPICRITNLLLLPLIEISPLVTQCSAVFPLIRIIQHMPAPIFSPVFFFFFFFFFDEIQQLYHRIREELTPSTDIPCEYSTNQRVSVQSLLRAQLRDKKKKDEIYYRWSIVLCRFRGDANSHLHPRELARHIQQVYPDIACHLRGWLGDRVAGEKAYHRVSPIVFTLSRIPVFFVPSLILCSILTHTSARKRHGHLGHIRRCIF